MKMRLDPQTETELEEAATSIRSLSLATIAGAGWGHIGGSFSLAEILAVLYFDAMWVDPGNPDDPDRDRLILSKAHGSPALYAALSLRGFLRREMLDRYCRIGGLDGHTSSATPGVDYSGGSLGTGLAYGVGVALGLRMKESFSARVFCLLGDGELNEGQIWESAMAAAHYKLDNLIVIVDYNKVAAKGAVHELMAVEPLAAKWEAFGFSVEEVDGHDVRELHQTIYRARNIWKAGQPICIVAHTVKGRSVREAEFNYRWHTHAPDANTARRFHDELSATSLHPRTEDRVPALPAADRGLKGVVEDDLS